MVLYSTAKSHFSRKVRILIAALDLEVDLVDIGNVGQASHDIFGANPLMKVPTLIDGECVIFDSDHIAQYLVHKYDSKDQFDVLTCNVEKLNIRAVINGIMSGEVELVLAERSGIDTTKSQRYEKIRKSIISGLSWLEYRTMSFPVQPSYLGFHLTAMWEHLVLYDLVQLDYPKLRSYVEKLSSLEYVSRSAPH